MTVLSTERELQEAYRGDDVAASYVARRFQSELHRLLHEKQTAAVQRLLDRIGAQPALEIAPGPGRITRDVRPAGRLVCLEFNAGMIEQGKAACSASVEWVRGNAFDLSFEEEFSLVYSFRFIRHFRLDDRRRLYAGIRRALRPGGWLLFDAVNERFSRPLRAAQPDEYPIYDELYRPDDLRRELADAGFDGVTLEPVQKRHWLQGKSDILVGPRSAWLNRAVVRGLETLPRREGLEWIVACRRA